ncbi:hypothetical protein HCN44_006610 [Aphidius gifuensis]|uniref:Nucleoporin NSP1-like C-terminal domain-containing protein n=1 Tax=Aphidius gifuensis TaxID=684658 RepID=A0A834XXT2_APHGI|nr:nuclear pore glycoprotein p62 [Aphidius gifuensis]KAF7995503.1 hypothetical protein HCN44_006610 [Aphidius gifuensis]
MNFSDPSKTGQPGGIQSTTPGFGAGTNDPNKPLGAFSMPSMQNQAKPGGFTLGSTPAPAFGSTPAPTFGSLGTPATSTPGALSFGATPMNQPSTLSFGTTPAASTGGISFGMNTNTPATSFGAMKMPSLTTATPNTAQGGLSFGTPKTSTTSGFTLGGTTTNTGTTPAPAFGSLPTPASTGFTLGGGATLTTTNPPAPAATTGGGISFGMTNTSIAPTSIPSTGLTLSTPASIAPTSATSGFSLLSNTTTTTAAATTTTTTTSATLGFSLTGNTASTAASTGFTTSTAAVTLPSTANTAPPPTTLGNVTTVTPSSNSGQSNSINFCQLEESINKWTLELEEQERAFVNQATQINAWDKLLIANGEKIVTLNEEVERVKVEQQKLEHELDYVVGQQKELQDCLIPLEKENSSLSVSDSERVSTYRLAENLDTQLKQMSEDLKEIIEHLNEANRGQDSSDPMVQIGKILNAHMNSLQWLDQKTSIIGQKIQQIDQLHQNYRQENERSFSLAYN